MCDSRKQISLDAALWLRYQQCKCARDGIPLIDSHVVRRAAYKCLCRARFVRGPRSREEVVAYTDQVRVSSITKQ